MKNTAEAIEMLFGLLNDTDPRNHVFDVGPDPPMGRGIFVGERADQLEEFTAPAVCLPSMLGRQMR